MTDTMDEQYIQMKFETLDELYMSYMSFIKGGGLFIRTQTPVDLGVEVDLELQLPDDLDCFKVKARVVWLTPKGAQGVRAAGMGVQLLEDNTGVIRTKIETLLAGTLHSTKKTDTL